MNKQTSNFLIVTVLAVGAYFLFRPKGKAEATATDMTQEEAQEIANEIALIGIGESMATPQEEKMKNQLIEKLEEVGYRFVSVGRGEGKAIKKFKTTLHKASVYCGKIAVFYGRKYRLMKGVKGKGGVLSYHAFYVLVSPAPQGVPVTVSPQISKKEYDELIKCA